LSVKQFGSQMRPHFLWGLIWFQIVYKGHQGSSKFFSYNQTGALLDSGIANSDVELQIRCIK